MKFRNLLWGIDASDMKTPLIKSTREDRNRSQASEYSQSHNRLGLSTAPTETTPSNFEDNRPEATVQRNLQKLVNNSPPVQRLTQMQEMIDSSPSMVAQRKQMEYVFSRIAQKKENKISIVGPESEKHGPHKVWQAVLQKQQREAEGKSATEMPNKDIEASERKVQLHSLHTIQLNGDKPNMVWTDQSQKLANEKLPSRFQDTGALYQGVLFRFRVFTESGKPAQGNVKEIIIPESNTGIFESIPNTAQSLEVQLDNGQGWDANVLSVGGENQLGEETVKEASVERNSVPDTGTSSVRQYFVYLDNGDEKLIKYSGYRITKILKPGKLTVIRESASFPSDHGDVGGGMGEIGQFEIDI